MVNKRGFISTPILRGEIINPFTKGTVKVGNYTKIYPDIPIYDDPDVSYDDPLNFYNISEEQTENPAGGRIKKL